MTRLKLSAEERAQYLNDLLVKAWVKRLAKGSDKTATMWASGLACFLHLTHTSPKALVALNKKQLMALAEEYEAAERARGTRASTIASRLGFVRNFVQFSGDLTLPTGTFKVKGGDDVVEEPALTRDQLHAVLVTANPREKAAVVLMLSGLRPGVVGNFDGTDGLALADLPDLTLDGAISFTTSPAVVVVRKELSKAGHSYLAMMGEEAQRLLCEYLELRRRGGEVLTPRSSVVATDRQARPFPRSSEVGDYVRNAFERAKVKARPYSLRTTYISRLSGAEADGLVSHEYRLFWSGHRGDMSQHYALNHGRLGDDTVARMRAAFARCEPLLSTQPPAKRERIGIAERAILRAANFTDAEIEAMDPERLAEAVEGAAERFINQPATVPKPAKGAKPLKVTFDQLGEYLSNGWRQLATDGSGHFLVGPN